MFGGEEWVDLDQAEKWSTKRIDILIHPEIIFFYVHSVQNVRFQTLIVGINLKTCQ